MNTPGTNPGTTTAVAATTLADYTPAQLLSSAVRSTLLAVLFAATLIHNNLPTTPGETAAAGGLAILFTLAALSTIARLHTWTTIRHNHP